MGYVRFLIILTFFQNFTDAAKILGVFSCPSYSHQIVFRSIWLELAKRGHDVTVITPDIDKEANYTNLRQIDANHAYKIFKSKIDFSKVKPIYFDLNIWKSQYIEQQEAVLAIDEFILKMEPVKKIINEEKFDLVIVQWFTSTMIALGAKFKCPTIAVTSLTPYNFMFEALGTPAHSVINPEYLTGYEEDLTFLERFKTTFFSIWLKFYYWSTFIPRTEKLINENLGRNLPPLSEIQRNVNFFFYNAHPLATKSRPNPTNVIEFSGLQLREDKPLPEDIKNYLDNCTEGFIYLSLGTNVKSSLLSQGIFQKIMKAVEELPYKVLWKYETDLMPNKPDNVMIKKWIPQQDVLGHKNIKVFVTQGGSQSLEEAMHNAVPIVGIPFFSDQPRNIRKVTELGLGLGVDSKTFTKDDLKRTILEVASNQKYKYNMGQRSALMKDVPMKSLDKVIWYIEYALRHKGAKYLKSSYADIPFWKFFLLDQLLFLLIILVLVFISIKVTTDCIYRISKKYFNFKQKYA